tara:strand:+ start:227 stop:772 length:546 start_codon:yes stop_codon:yes gene_type:complete
MLREKIHTRSVISDGYRREDGLWDIEATIQDVKHYAFQNNFHGKINPEEPYHSMWVCLTIDAYFEIKEIQVKTLKGPFEMCPNIVQNYQRLVGVKIGHAWQREVKRKVGRTEGCTHINELILYIGTVAFQTIMPDLIKKRSEKKEAGESKSEFPSIVNSCHAWAEDSLVTKKLLLDHYKEK